MTEPTHHGANGADPGGGAGLPRGAIAMVLSDPERAAALRRRVEETTESMHAIAGAFDLPSASLTRHANRAGWSRPAGAPVAQGGSPAGRKRLASDLDDAEGVAARLLRAVDRQLGRIEATVKKAGAEIDEKDARILGHLAKTLTTLMALERDDGAPGSEPEPVDRDALNADLARRIARWASGGEGRE